MTSAAAQSQPATQSRYQVRFAWGHDGATAVGEGAHVLVWIDALPGRDSAPPPPPAGGWRVEGGAGAREVIADWILARQADLGDRAYVAVVAAGGADGAFAVEDLVAAGAVIDALADRGIDFTSPEAAAAAGAWVALRNAGSHVLTASVAGQELLASAGPEALERARVAASSLDFAVVQA